MMTGGLDAKNSPQLAAPNRKETSWYIYEE